MPPDVVPAWCPLSATTTKKSRKGTLAQQTPQTTRTPERGEVGYQGRRCPYLPMRHFFRQHFATNSRPHDDGSTHHLTRVPFKTVVRHTQRSRTLEHSIMNGLLLTTLLTSYAKTRKQGHTGTGSKQLSPLNHSNEEKTASPTAPGTPSSIHVDSAKPRGTT
ncbi:unnamed protein product [Ectocarpus sp. 12 AP-2014]